MDRHASHDAVRSNHGLFMSPTSNEPSPPSSSSSSMSSLADENPGSIVESLQICQEKWEVKVGFNEEDDEEGGMPMFARSPSFKVYVTKADLNRIGVKKSSSRLGENMKNKKHHTQSHDLGELQRQELTASFSLEKGGSSKSPNKPNIQSRLFQRVVRRRNKPRPFKTMFGAGLFNCYNNNGSLSHSNSMNNNKPIHVSKSSNKGLGSFRRV